MRRKHALFGAEALRVPASRSGSTTIVDDSRLDAWRGPVKRTILKRPIPWALAWALLLAGPGLARLHAGFLTTSYQARDVTIRGTTYSTTGKHVPKVPYDVKGVPWEAVLDPTDAQELKRGGTDNFLKVLREMFPEKLGWSFVAADKDLSDKSVIVHSYHVHAVDILGKPNFVGIEGDTFGNRNQGFDVEYKPGTGDPRDNTHWIQVIRDDHAINRDLQGKLVVDKHGQNENRVDVPQGATLPYYDKFFSADGSNFIDTPRRADFGESHFWSAELYLVVGPEQPGQVTIYNGIAWGWQNHNVPAPASAVLLGCGALGVLAARWRRRRLFGAAADFPEPNARAAARARTP